MSTPATVERSKLTFLRVVISLQTLAVFVTAITAGLMLSSLGGTPHSIAAYGVFAMALLHLVAALLAWRIGGVPPRPTMLYAVGFLVATLLQIALGVAGVPAVHVPLGVLMFGGSIFQLSQVLAGRAYVAVSA